MQGWLDEIPHHPLPYTGSAFTPVACVEHRTIGHWAGDFATLSRGRVPSVHILIGEEWGQWVQFYSLLLTCAHAAGANGYAIGIEFSGANGAPLTTWQLHAGEIVHRQLLKAGLKSVFLANGEERVAYFAGFLNHSNVLTTPKYTHYDYIARSEWKRMTDSSAAVGEEDMFTWTGTDGWAKDKHFVYGPDGNRELASKEEMQVLAILGIQHHNLAQASYQVFRTAPAAATVPVSAPAVDVLAIAKATRDEFVARPLEAK